MVVRQVLQSTAPPHTTMRRVDGRLAEIEAQRVMLDAEALVLLREGQRSKDQMRGLVFDGYRQLSACAGREGAPQLSILGAIMRLPLEFAALSKDGAFALYDAAKELLAVAVGTPVLVSGYPHLPGDPWSGGFVGAPPYLYFHSSDWYIYVPCTWGMQPNEQVTPIAIPLAFLQDGLHATLHARGIYIGETWIQEGIASALTGHDGGVLPAEQVEQLRTALQLMGLSESAQQLLLACR